MHSTDIIITVELSFLVPRILRNDLISSLPMQKLNSSSGRNAIRMIVTMLCLLTVSSFLIYFGSRGDATTIAQKIKSGVLTSDEVNIAFENVGGKLLSRKVDEAYTVKKGDVLLVLDDTDTRISIDKIRAQISAQEAKIKQQEQAILIETENTRLKEVNSWREIEQLNAALQSAKSAENLAYLEYDRSRKLISSKSISKSAYDANESTLTRARQAAIQAQRQLDSATLGATKEQLSKLHSTGSAEGMTLSTILNARLNIDNMTNTVNAMKASLAELNASLSQLLINEKRLYLKAPEDGKVLKILYQEGEMISPNSPAVILETTRRYFDIYVSEKQVGKYKEGEKVSARVVATDETVEGKIKTIDTAPSFSDLRMTRENGQADLTMFKIRIYIDESANVRTGMTLEVDND